MPPMTRRDFVRTAGELALLSPLLKACTDKDALVDDTAAGQRVEYTLSPAWLTTTLEDPNMTERYTVKLRAYNGALPGPMMEVAPGDTLVVTIDNQLTEYDSSAWSGDHNVPHELNTTNLHLHGLDVLPHLFDPVGTSDPAASMIAIAPGESFTYTFPIPADHPTGLFWYHPHHHGSTAVQAASGLAGLIVVRGAIDEVPEIAAARELFLVISDLGLFPSDDPEEPDVWVYEPPQNAIWDTFGGAVVEYQEDGTKTPTDYHGGFTTGDYALRFYAANGVPFFRELHNSAAPTEPLGTQLTPMPITMQPGEVIRLRVLNATSDLVMPLALEGMDMQLIAMDGVNFTAPRTLSTVEPTSWDGVADYSSAATTLVLAPANRAEMLLKAGSGGTFNLVQAAHSGEQFLAAERKVIATITISGDPLDMALPSTLPEPSRLYPLIDETELVAMREFMFTGKFPAQTNWQVGIDFSINDDEYQEHRIDTEVMVGTAEQWTIQAMVMSGGNAEGHPFHVHVNAFEVKSIDGVDQPAGTVMDTIWTGKGKSVVTWMRFVEHVGKSVYHCHILPHEDTGMMHNLLIT